MSFEDQIKMKLKNERDNQGLSQREVADLLPFRSSAQEVSNVERGVAGLRIDRAHMWCEVLGLKLSELIGALEEGKLLIVPPKTVEVGGHTYVLQEDAS